MVSSSNFFQACSLSSERPFMHWAGYTWSFVFAVAAAPAANFLLTCHHFLAVKQPFSAAGHLRLVFDVINILSWIQQRNKQRKERGRNRRNEWMDACCKCDIYTTVEQIKRGPEKSPCVNKNVPAWWGNKLFAARLFYTPNGRILMWRKPKGAYTYARLLLSKLEQRPLSRKNAAKGASEEKVIGYLSIIFWVP